MQNMIAIFEKKQLREKGADREATIRTINEWNADLEKMKRQFPKL